MSDIALPFVGFIELSQIHETTRDVLLGKMLSGEHQTYVYSSEANGKLEPVHITPAEFFKAWRSSQQEAACDENDCLDANGFRLKRMDPFQIRVSDQDSRRSSAIRRRIGVPHWIYLLKADLAPPKGKGGRPKRLNPAAVDAKVQELMTDNGEFSPDDNWNALTRLYDALRQEFGEVSDSTLEPYVKEPLDRWRQSKKSSPKT